MVKFERIAEPEGSGSPAGEATSGDEERSGTSGGILAAKAAEGVGHPVVSDPMSDLIHALDRAEAKPGYEFVALKWFRDTFLPAEGFVWASSDSARNNILREATEKRLVLTSKVPNPRSPEFPVTAIRLNRLLPETKAILGRTQEPDADFQPIEIRGEPLSQTVLRGRR